MAAHSRQATSRRELTAVNLRMMKADVAFRLEQGISTEKRLSSVTPESSVHPKLARNGVRGNVGSTLNRRLRLSPVPLKEMRNRIIALICPFLPQRAFLNCPSIRKMDGRGGWGSNSTPITQSY